MLAAPTFRPATPKAPEIALRSGAVARITGSLGAQAVICVNGGSGRERPGNWSATLEYLVARLAPAFPSLAFVEVRYRVKSWKQLSSCIDDGRAALDAVASEGARECALLGFSMGGAVAIAIADHPAVSRVIGLAPWIPDRLDVSPLDGKRISVVHGRLDGIVPGLPGVNPRQTLRGLRRIRDRGIEASYALVSGAIHGVAVHTPWGGLVPLPRAERWVELVAAELDAFRGVAGAAT